MILEESLPNSGVANREKESKNMYASLSESVYTVQCLNDRMSRVISSIVGDKNVVRDMTNPLSEIAEFPNPSVSNLILALVQEMETLSASIGILEKELE